MSAVRHCAKGLKVVLLALIFGLAGSGASFCAINPGVITDAPVVTGRDVTFMELAAPVQALTPGVDAGVQTGRPFLQERMTWTAGVFSQGVGRDYGDASENYARVIARLTGLPLDKSDPNRPEASGLLHLGLSANVLYSANSSVRYQTRPESRQAPYLLLALRGRF